MDFIAPFIPALASFLAVLGLIPLAANFAHKIGFVDKPGGRKQHDHPVPLIGGLVMFPVYMVVSLLMGQDFQTLLPLFCALTLVLIMGAVDDRKHIAPWTKMALQVMAASIIVLAGNVRLYHLGNLFGFGDFGLGFMSIPFSIIAVTLLINAINLMDGLDGLAGGKALIVFIWLMIACLFAGLLAPVVMMAPIVGALLGFLFYNMRHPLRDRASIFLGDAGSMGLGLIIAWFSIALTQGTHPVLVPISVAWILLLPIADTCAQFYRRAREGRHPFSPDRGHFHYHFIEAGFEVHHSTVVILLIGFIFGGIGYLGVYLGVPEVILTILWIAILLSHMALSQKPDFYITLVSQLKTKFTRVP